jgi:hypothetical protein
MLARAPAAEAAPKEQSATRFAKEQLKAIIERINAAGWQERGRQTLKKILGFDWPW